jgi:GNAT superfamily N-acetyltransferase
MKVRLANKFDLLYYLHLVHSIHEEGLIGTYKVPMDDTYLNTLFNTIIHGAGIALIVESDEPIGMMIGVICPNIWSPETQVMHQILLFVDEEYRHTRAGHMLITEYIDKCQEMKAQNRIHYHTISATKTMFDLDFTRFGFDCIEKTWLSNGVE